MSFTSAVQFIAFLLTLAAAVVALESGSMVICGFFFILSLLVSPWR